MAGKANIEVRYGAGLGLAAFDGIWANIEVRYGAGVGLAASDRI